MPQNLQSDLVPDCFFGILMAYKLCGQRAGYSQSVLHFCFENMKDIPGFEGLYAATKEGKIWSHTNKKFRKISTDSRGYCHLGLCKKGVVKNYMLHRLVALTYIPNRKNLPHINHKNCTKGDNDVKNLEWCTAKENIQHAIINNLRHPARGVDHGNSFLSEDDVREIRRQKERGDTLVEIGKHFNADFRTISQIVNRKRWNHIV